MTSPVHMHCLSEPAEPRFFASSASLGETCLGPLDALLSCSLSLGSQESPLSPLAPTNTYALNNAVHMEIQENAKLPTFNLPVDRSNSSHSRTSNPKLAPTTSHDMDELIRLAEKDINLTEMFLKSHDRSSVNKNWSSAGAMLSYIGERVDAVDSTCKPDSVTGAQSPKLGSSSSLHSASVPRSVTIPSFLHSSRKSDLPVTPSAASASTPGKLAQYPYHRSSPLPIPKRLSPETTDVQAGTASGQSNGKESTDDAMKAALATAAAIASATQMTAPCIPTQSTLDVAPCPESPSHSTKLPPPTFPSSQTVQSTLQPPSDSSDQPKSQQASSPNTRHPGALLLSPTNTPARCQSHHTTIRQSARAHATAPTGSIMAATKQRSQFGFGGNHVVPSVPLPPPESKRRAAPPPPPEPTGVAYERKKQRAKDMRVKLNESIERLAIAISLTGTQSKQRSAQLQSMPLPYGGMGFRSNTIHIIDECGKISTEAKKWDRPSFVGSAAALIQSLNAQCEALMNEMLQMRRQAGETSANMENARVTPSHLQYGDSNDCSSSSEVTLPSAKRKDFVVTAKRNMIGVSAKRPRFEEMNGKSVAHDAHLRIHSILSKMPTLKVLLSMLDPRSLIRCTEVSKHWAKIFKSDQAWLDRLMDRFGHYNVRQWKEKMEDEHLPACSSIKLYRNMDLSNVRPYCRLEGSLVLGEARMPGKVSAWASMVERSNGETIRSVLLESDKRTYSSLPVVELRLLIQNTGLVDCPIVLKEQTIMVDASTRRRGEEMKEIHWDDRLKKKVLNLDGIPRAPVERNESPDMMGELCRLKLYEAVVLVVHIHARGCSTTSKFQHKSNFSKVLVTLNGTTVPLVIPFFRESNIS